MQSKKCRKTWQKNCLDVSLWTVCDPLLNFVFIQDIINDFSQILVICSQILFCQIIEIVNDACKIEVGPC